MYRLQSGGSKDGFKWKFVAEFGFGSSLSVAENQINTSK
jgi:hypothetical protein